MESLISVSPSVILPPTTTTTISVSTSRSVSIRLRSHRSSSFSGRRISLSRRRHLVSCKLTGGGSDKLGGDEEESEEVERALHLDGTIPGTSDEFVRQVSSRAYEMRRKLEQTFDSTSYDGIISNHFDYSSWQILVAAYLCCSGTQVAIAFLCFISYYFLPFISSDTSRYGIFQYNLIRGF